jgi:hypothetical protein
MTTVLRQTQLFAEQHSDNLGVHPHSILLIGLCYFCNSGRFVIFIVDTEVVQRLFQHKR